MSSQIASLYLRSIDSDSKWRHSIRTSVHYPFHVWYCIRSIINTQDGRHGGYIWHQIMHIWGIVAYTHIMIATEWTASDHNSDTLVMTGTCVKGSSIYLDSGILETAWRSYTYAKYNMHTLHKNFKASRWVLASCLVRKSIPAFCHLLSVMQGQKAG